MDTGKSREAYGEIKYRLEEQIISLLHYLVFSYI